MSKVMVSLVVQAEPPTPADIERRYALPAGAVDRQFGVVEVDDITHEFAVMVEESLVSHFRSTPDWQIKGPFSNPRIEPFGNPISE